MGFFSNSNFLLQKTWFSSLFTERYSSHPGGRSCPWTWAGVQGRLEPQQRLIFLLTPFNTPLGRRSLIPWLRSLSVLFSRGQASLTLSDARGPHQSVSDQLTEEKVPWILPD